MIAKQPAAAGPTVGEEAAKRHSLGGIAIGLILGAAFVWVIVNHSRFESMLLPSSSYGTRSHSGAGDSGVSAAAGVWKEFPNMTANLAGGTGALQATVAVEFADDAAKDRLEKVRPLAQARILDILGRVSYEQIVDPTAKVRIAHDIEKALNTVLASEYGNPDVRQVVFTAFVFSSE